MIDTTNTRSDSAHIAHVFELFRSWAATQQRPNELSLHLFPASQTGWWGAIDDGDDHPWSWVDASAAEGHLLELHAAEAIEPVPALGSYEEEIDQLLTAFARWASLVPGGDREASPELRLHPGGNGCVVYNGCTITPWTSLADGIAMVRQLLRVREERRQPFSCAGCHHPLTVHEHVDFGSSGSANLYHPVDPASGEVIWLASPDDTPRTGLPDTDKTTAAATGDGLTSTRASVVCGMCGARARHMRLTLDGTRTILASA